MKEERIMKRKGVSYAKYGYIFSLPFVIAFLIFMLYPIAYTAIIGFTDLKTLFAGTPEKAIISASKTKITAKPKKL